MANHFHTAQLFCPQGNLLWEGSYADKNKCLIHVSNEKTRAAMSWLCEKKKDQEKVSGKEIYDVADRLGFITASGCQKGFYNILPNGNLVSQVIESFNRPFLQSLGAERIHFPLVFCSGNPRIAELVQSYERESRIFKLADLQKTYALSYAADPGLLCWLADSDIEETSLPYSIYTSGPVFRKWKTGEIGVMTNYNQYDLNDFHILCTQDAALAEYFKCVKLKSAGIRFWMGEEWFHLVETDSVSLAELKMIGRSIALESAQFTLVFVRHERPRYYSLKSGFMCDAGRKASMLYNLQLDKVNGARFNIRSKGEYIAIVHGAFMGSWPNILPMFISRSLAGIDAKVIPFLLAPVQVFLLPVSRKHDAFTAAALKHLQQSGLRVSIDNRPDRLGKRIKGLAENWQEYYVVIGDDEVGGKELVVQSTCMKQTTPLPEFLAAWASAIDKCRPSENHVRSLLKRKHTSG